MLHFLANELEWSCLDTFSIIIRGVDLLYDCMFEHTFHCCWSFCCRWHIFDNYIYLYRITLGTKNNRCFGFIDCLNSLQFGNYFFCLPGYMILSWISGKTWSTDSIDIHQIWCMLILYSTVTYVIKMKYGVYWFYYALMHPFKIKQQLKWVMSMFSIMDEK